MSPTKDAPPPDDQTGDFYDVEALLSDADRQLLTRVDATTLVRGPLVEDHVRSGR